MSIKLHVARSVWGSIRGTVGKIKMRTWLIAGAVMMGMLALFVWAVIALFGAAWGGAKNVLQQAGINSESVQQASAQVLASTQTVLADAQKNAAELVAAADAQAIKQRAEQSLAGVSETLAAEVQEGAQALDAKAAAAAAVALAGLANAVPAPDASNIVPMSAEVREVSGVDIGPPRFPGLRRTSFGRTQDLLTVSYQGSGSLADVLAHYQSGFAKLGFNGDVVSATTDSERHVFLNADQRIELALVQSANGAISVELKQLSNSPS